MADILFGKKSPSGKLPITFYRSLDSLPDFEDYSMKNRTYRYMRQEEALYPFGYGLTYGKVSVSAAEAVYGADGLCIRTTVKNVGDTATDEVLQIYIKNLDSPYAEENYHLCGFQRIFTEPGQEKTLEMPIEARDFTVVDENGRRFEDGKHFRFYIGFHQPDPQSCALTGDKVWKLEMERQDEK